jgi:hypothetical protein
MSGHTERGAAGGEPGALSAGPDHDVVAAVADVRTWLPVARIAAVAQFAAVAYATLPMLPMWLRWGPRFGPDCILAALLPLSVVLMFAGTFRVRSGVRGAPARIPLGLRLFGLGALLVGLPVVLMLGVALAQAAVAGGTGRFGIPVGALLLIAGFLAPMPVAVWGAVLHFRHRATLRAAS